MVDKQLRARGIHNVDVLRAMTWVPRHAFVPSEEEPNAYKDSPLEIGHGQTISQPYIVAFMTELLEVDCNHKVLEVGTGSGYQTAILASLAREVFTIELHTELQRQAIQRLRLLGFTNIEFLVRDGHFGWPEVAPFDRIVVTAAATSIPEALVDQIAPAGRMVIPVGPQVDDQILKLITKQNAFAVDIRDTVPVRFVPLVPRSRE